MAANRFATLVHRKSNRMTLVLVYAFLEWSLIFFLLLNSLFSYLILRFADCFGLKRPCLLCSRLDHFFGKSHSHRDLLCDDHTLEISKINGFVEAPLEKTASPDCTPIEPDRSRSIEEGEKVDSQKRSYTREEETEKKKKKKLPCETEEEQRKEEETEKDSTDDEDDGGGEIEEEEFSCYVSSFDFCKENEEEEENRVDLTMATEAEIAQGTDDKPEESAPPPENLEFYIDDQDCHLIPVEFYKPSEKIREISDINGDFILDFAAAKDSAFPPPSDEPKQNSSTDDSLQIQNNEEDTDAEVSIGTEIPDHDQIGYLPSFFNGEDETEEVTLEFRAITRPVLTLKNEERLLEIESFHAMFHVDNRGESETVDMLKFELEEERKALNALYEELEEERSASAVAANEAMAMINRLQEEKAAMQMEALQYQRMMEEQSEFDQEALQLLNELMVKREKENAELEEELEVCRMRLEEFEAKEKMSRRMRDSSVEVEMENTPVDVVLRLDECLDDYEGERVSILGRLKFLEEKLTALDDVEDKEANENQCSINGNGHCYGNETNGKQRVIKGKRLLPLFDAVDESGNGEIVTVEEEVDELYERVEALEADREFLRHCVGSLRKGDKGVHLLHEILQHLRDLRSMDLIHVREYENMSF